MGRASGDIIHHVLGLHMLVSANSPACAAWDWHKGLRQGVVGPASQGWRSKTSEYDRQVAERDVSSPLQGLSPSQGA